MNPYFLRLKLKIYNSFRIIYFWNRKYFYWLIKEHFREKKNTISFIFFQIYIKIIIKHRGEKSKKNRIKILDFDRFFRFQSNRNISNNHACMIYIHVYMVKLALYVGMDGVQKCTYGV